MAVEREHELVLTQVAQMADDLVVSKVLKEAASMEMHLVAVMVVW